MATFIPYIPKPPNAIIRKPSNLISRKLNSSKDYLQIESSDVLIEVLPAPRGVTRLQYGYPWVGF
jgi:hypothetical protein